MNQRRSKALFMTNVTAMYIEKGSVDNVENVRRERSRPDGVIEFNKGFTPPADIQKATDLQAQLALMQDARNEIDTFAQMNPALLTQDGAKDEHSGVAMNLMQKAGIAELGAFFRNYKDWKRRVYRAIWNITVRTWQQERWVRVTDNDGLAQFLQINGMGEDAYGEPTIINAIGALDVEIDMEDGPDEASVMQDVYDQIKDDPTVPFLVKLEFMPMSQSKKNEIKQTLQQQPNPIQLKMMQQQIEQNDANIADKQAQATERRARSMTDVARAAHLATEAGLNTQQVVANGMQQAAGLANPMAPTGSPPGSAPGAGGTQTSPQQPMQPQPSPFAQPPQQPHLPLAPPPAAGPMHPPV
jgi:hypothetical protein